MSAALIYNPSTMRVHKRYKTASAAKAAMTRMSKTQHVTHLEIITPEHYSALNVDVPVISLQGGKTVMIRRSAVGGCTDPSTELYWCM